MTERWQIEADIKSLQETGKWVDGVVPQWAAERAAELHVHATDSMVLQWGLEEVIRQLKDELFAAECRAPLGDE